MGFFKKNGFQMMRKVKNFQYFRFFVVFIVKKIIELEMPGPESRSIAALNQHISRVKT